MEKVILSVIIPTYNRADLLKTVINSLKKQTYPADGYEILIVDNGSEDHTQSIAHELIQKNNPSIYYLYEPKVGISYARNRGAHAAHGEIIIYIDDDAIAEPGWLTAISDVFSDCPEVVCVGGRIELWWEKKRPVWFGPKLEGYLGGNRYLGEQLRQFPAGVYPFGGNLAIRKNAFLAVPGGFDARFGHSGRQLGAHDETVMVDHLRDMGIIIYSPEACVYHFTPAERATHLYLMRRAYHIGQADVELDLQRQKRSRVGLIRSALINIAFLIGDLSRLIFYQITGHETETAYELVIVSSRFGRLTRTIRISLSLATGKI